MMQKRKKKESDVTLNGSQHRSQK